MSLSFALANGKQTVTGVWPAKAGDFSSLAIYFRAKWADDILFNHGKQTRVLFIFAEAIYRSFVDQFFQLRRRELLSCGLVIMKCAWRFVDWGSGRCSKPSACGYAYSSWTFGIRVPRLLEGEPPHRR